MNIYLIILLVACFEALAQTCIYQSKVTNNKMYFIMGIFFYVLVSFSVYQAYYYKGVGVVNAIWSAIDIVLLLLVGHLLFNEQISVKEYIGLFLILVGIFLTHKN